MISRIALIAAAGLLLGAAMTPAMAADLGGGCCADLEERVAELEATTARKGNRVVTLQIYGTVAKGLLIWDDGEESDAYVVDNDAITSIVGFKGSAKMKPGWNAGFKVELGITDASSFDVNQFDDEGKGGIGIRESLVYIESERLGRVSLGQQLLAADGVAGVSVANTLYGANADHSNGLFVIDDEPLLHFANSFGTGRNDAIRYDSPSIYGFIASATWGDDNYWDVALRFAKEWNSIKIAAAIAYANAEPDPGFPLGIGGVGYTGGDQEILSGSVSMMHQPTGLFINFGTGTLEDDDDNEASFIFVQGGIERKWLSYGSTTLHAEYGNYEDQLTLFDPTVTGSEATRWGFGIVQHFDSAALDLYAQATFWDFSVDGGEFLDDDVNDISTIMIGAKIDF